MKSVWREPPYPPEHPPFCGLEQILLVPLRSQSVTLIMTTDRFLGSGKVVTVLPGWLSPSSGNFDQAPWGWEPMSRKSRRQDQVHQGPLPFTACVILGKPLSFWGLFSFLFGKAEIMTQAQIKQKRNEGICRRNHYVKTGCSLWRCWVLTGANWGNEKNQGS